MGTITINGQSFSGNSIHIDGDGNIEIDGLRKGDKVSGVVEVRILEGTVEKLESKASITCKTVTGQVNAGGSVNCDDVGGSVSSGGSTNAGDVKGNVTAGGSVNCGKVGGDVKASGSVRHG